MFFGTFLLYSVSSLKFIKSKDLETAAGHHHGWHDHGHGGEVKNQTF